MRRDQMFVYGAVLGTVSRGGDLKSKAMLLGLLERGVEVNLFDSPSFMRFSWELVNEIPVKDLRLLKWLSRSWLAGPAAHNLDKKFGEERAEVIRVAHGKE